MKFQCKKAQKTIIVAFHWFPSRIFFHFLKLDLLCLIGTKYFLFSKKIYLNSTKELYYWRWFSFRTPIKYSNHTMKIHAVISIAFYHLLQLSCCSFHISQLEYSRVSWCFNKWIFRNFWIFEFRVWNAFQPHLFCVSTRH